MGKRLSFGPRIVPLGMKFDHWIQFDTNGGCWLWSGSQTPEGYGKVSIGKDDRVLAHRAMWRHMFGDIPGGMLVCHKCDVRTCVNPSHLFLGTTRQNIDDKISKGRGRSGVRLSGRQVRTIERNADLPTTALARLTQCHRSTVLAHRRKIRAALSSQREGE